MGANLQPANGAVIVDPYLGRVIAWGHDNTTIPTQSPHSHNLLTSKEQSEHVKAEDGNMEESFPRVPSQFFKFEGSASNGLGVSSNLLGWHPLRHAVMAAIDMAASRDRSLFPSDVAIGRTNDSGAEDEFQTGTVAKKARTEVQVSF